MCKVLNQTVPELCGSPSITLWHRFQPSATLDSGVLSFLQMVQ